ncbi:hypothetical protein PDE_07040 [Penicillium oxalicum 114-2]|uniref:Uncharacterized protein n=1 Tax=Penicillium oxalicum (strain 114-2 / CGMCC 5302) TaxID=933388 RepID=S7ZTI6_PENO1|nr:hypothetical protein PDE_07040 [Penicillium oxalicum 114-2]
MDQEEAPPPYSAEDPLIPPTHSRNGISQDTRLSRGDESAVTPATGSTTSRSSTPVRSAVVPTHFTSAAAYFEERPPTVLDGSREVLHHSMAIYPRSSAKDFPRRPRCWSSRVEEVAQQDWDVFLRHLFPPQLGLASASRHLPRQLRAEIQRDRKDRPQETDEQRQARISAVVDEWNQCFFEPRATHLSFVYVGESDPAPSSALCPRCYPAATRATQQPASEVPQTPSPNPGPPVTGYPAPPFNGWPASPNQIHPYYQQPAPYGPYGAMPQFPPHGPVPNYQPPQYIPPPLSAPGVQQWQWNQWAYNQPQYAAQRPEKSSGALGWISSLTSQAQKYGERFAEQAQHYGDQISTQAMHYGRQVEDQALAHGRWIEEQARLHGRKQGAYPSTPYAAQTPFASSGQVMDVSQNAASLSSGINTPSRPVHENPHSHNATPIPQGEAANSRRCDNNDKAQTVNTEANAPGPRRSSISSLSSQSSLSSIDTISTTSDLSSADLAAVRTQLQGLQNSDDRTQYAAAVDLRQQLDTLRESRREAKVSGLQNRRPRPNLAQGSGTDSSDWGRWDSPEQQARELAERRAMKAELRHTQQAFRDVVRHARNEKRNRRLARQNNRVQGPRSSGPPVENRHLLNDSMASLCLDKDQAPKPVHVQTEAAPSSDASRSVSTVPSVAADPILGATPRITSAGPINDASDGGVRVEERKSKTHGRLKDILRPLGSKKQPKDKSLTKAKDSKRDTDGA